MEQEAQLKFKRYGWATLIAVLIVAPLDWFRIYSDSLQSNVSGMGPSKILMLLLPIAMLYFIAIAFIFSPIMSITEKVTLRSWIQFLFFVLIASFAVYIITNLVTTFIFHYFTSFLCVPVYFFVYSYMKRQQEKTCTFSS